MVVIDAHQHFWDPERVSYPWLARGYPSLDRRFGFEHLAPLMAVSGVQATVLVQSADNAADTEAMFHIADCHREIAGVVGWVPLDRPAAAEAMLGRWAEHNRFCGIRNLIHDQVDPDWVIRPEVLDGLALLERARVPFDLVAVLPRHLEHIPTICERLPELRLVIDHLGKPPVGGRDGGPWWDLIARAAASPNVFAKVSGLYPSAADAGRWEVEDLRPFLERAMEVFGPDRLMFGSDWPICEVAGGYERVTSALLSLVAELDLPARAAVLGGAALQFYGLSLGLEEESP